MILIPVVMIWNTSVQIQFTVLFLWYFWWSDMSIYLIINLKQTKKILACRPKATQSLFAAAAKLIGKPFESFFNSLAWNCVARAVHHTWRVKWRRVLNKQWIAMTYHMNQGKSECELSSNFLTQLIVDIAWGRSICINNNKKYYWVEQRKTDKHRYPQTIELNFDKWRVKHERALFAKNRMGIFLPAICLCSSISSSSSITTCTRILSVESITCQDISQKADGYPHVMTRGFWDWQCGRLNTNIWDKRSYPYNSLRFVIVLLPQWPVLALHYRRTIYANVHRKKYSKQILLEQPAWSRNLARHIKSLELQRILNEVFHCEANCWHYLCHVALIG